MWKVGQTDRNGVKLFLVVANLGKNPFYDKQIAVERVVRAGNRKCSIHLLSHQPQENSFYFEKKVIKPFCLPKVPSTESYSGWWCHA